MNVGDQVLVPPSAKRYGGKLANRWGEVVGFDGRWVTLLMGSTHWPFLIEELNSNEGENEEKNV